MRMHWLYVGLMTLAASASGALAQTKEVTFAHQDMLVPLRVLMAQGAIEKATGYKINWRLYGGGGDVIKAMAANQAQIGEVGSSPAAAGASQNLDIEVIWILDDIANAEALVAHPKAKAASIKDLKGKRIATPFVSTAHYQLLFALQQNGLTRRDVTVMNMRPPEIAAAWERGDIDGAFIWDPVLTKIRQGGGKLLVTSADVARMGRPTFDAIIVNKAWAASNKEFVTTLVREIAKIDARYRQQKARWGAESEEAKMVAKIVGAKPEDVPPAMAAYRFPTPSEQASASWLGGGKKSLVAKALQDTSQFLVEQGRITDAKPDYSGFVNPEYAIAAARK